jgi:hypothetical protein
MLADVMHRRLPTLIVVVAALTTSGIAQRPDILEPERPVSGELAAGARRTYDHATVSPRRRVRGTSSAIARPKGGRFSSCHRTPR